MVADREFSREVEIARVPAGGRPFRIAAEPAERSALAARFGIERIDRLVAEGTVTRAVSGTSVTVAGRLEAEVVQRCVVTLEPVASRVVAELSRIFVPGAGPSTGEVVVDPLADEPEPLEGGTLDLGEIVAEELALALDPYPRAPGAALAGLEPVGAGEGRASGPGAGQTKPDSRRGGRA